MSKQQWSLTNQHTNLGVKIIFGAIMFVSSSAFAGETVGDPYKYSNRPDAPSCKFFDGYAENGDGTVTDPRSGLMWKKCDEFSAWDGKQCVSKYKDKGVYFDKVDRLVIAVNGYLNHNDWRLPTDKEYKDVLGNPSDCPSQGVGKPWAASPSLIGLGQYGFYWTADTTYHKTDNITIHNIADFWEAKVKKAGPRFIDPAIKLVRGTPIYIGDVTADLEYRQLYNVASTGSEKAIKLAYSKAATPDEKKQIEQLIVRQFKEKLVTTKMTAQAVGSPKTFGTDNGTGALGQFITSLAGVKVGTDAQTRVNYTIAFDPKLFKIMGDYNFSAKVVLTAHGAGRADSNCMWPLPTICEKTKTQDEYTQPISGVLSSNVPATGSVVFGWQPKYDGITGGGLRRSFNTKKVTFTITEIQVSPK